MTPSRRDLGFFFAAMQAGAQDTLPSKLYKYDELTVKTAANGNKSRAILDGKTHSGYRFEMHESELGPGLAPHPPHQHVHEELVFVREGTLEVTILGKSDVLTAGGIAYVASNEEHGWKNVGKDRAKYTILTLRG